MFSPALVFASFSLCLSPDARATDFDEINTTGRDPLERKRQAARCMDCGTPFCQTHSGCPINNLIPEWNTLVFEDQWQQAIQRLHKTNNFPEFTGRVCPAPCEGSCVAGLIDKPVTIKNMEYSIVDRAWQEGWITPTPPQSRTGQRVAVVGSGPAGLAAADQLNQEGHEVTVFERAPVPGGLLTYGIPNMKLDKGTVERRLDKMRAEGVAFQCSVSVGSGADQSYDWGQAPMEKKSGEGYKSVSVEALRDEYDAVLLATGATAPRDLPIPGRDLSGIHYAMDFLTVSQQALFDRSGDDEAAMHAAFGEGDAGEGGEGGEGAYEGMISARGKHVVVIGGGDTGTDCIGTSIRHGCASMTNLELLPQPPAERSTANPWPEWPRVFKVDYGHGEAKAVFGSDPRRFSVMSKEFLSEDGEAVSGLRLVQVEEKVDPETGATTFVEVPDTVEDIKADLVLLAMGFVSPEQALAQDLGMATDARNNM